jgi:PAS domain S-box-containing protein
MTGSPRSPENTDPVALLRPAMSEVLNGIDVPSYVIDAAGTLRWANRAATRLLGERLGQPYLSFVSADTRDRAKDHFARKIVGGFPTAYEIAVVDRDGRRVALKVHAAPLRTGGQVVGIFGLAIPVDDGLSIPPHDERPLTPRQVEILLLLAEGSNTQAIASELGIAAETVRNHIRGLFRRLDAHTRLEAVAAARRGGLLKGNERERTRRLQP